MCAVHKSAPIPAALQVGNLLSIVEGLKVTGMVTGMVTVGFVQQTQQTPATCALVVDHIFCQRRGVINERRWRRRTRSWSFVSIEGIVNQYSDIIGEHISDGNTPAQVRADCIGRILGGEGAVGWHW